MHASRTPAAMWQFILSLANVRSKDGDSRKSESYFLAATTALVGTRLEPPQAKGIYNIELTLSEHVKTHLPLLGFATVILG